MNEKIVIGITGSFATGKSTVAEMFKQKGAYLVDADAIAHEILDEEGIKEKIISSFGKGVLNGDRIDRNLLRKKVFSSSENTKKINDIMHPAIIKKIEEFIIKFDQGIILIDAPLLIETDLHEKMDIVIIVYADEEKQIERAKAKGISEEEALKILSNQMPLSEKKALANYIIDNNGKIEITKKGVEEIWKKIKDHQGRR